MFLSCFHSGCCCIVTFSWGFVVLRVFSHSILLRYFPFLGCSFSIFPLSRVLCVSMASLSFSRTLGKWLLLRASSSRGALLLFSSTPPSFSFSLPSNDFLLLKKEPRCVFLVFFTFYPLVSRWLKFWAEQQLCAGEKIKEKNVFSFEPFKMKSSKSKSLSV